jgi:RHS repeat-associated protein
VHDIADIPELGVCVYAFDGITYTNYNETTDANDEAVFTLPEGSYRFRADKDGTQFWSAEANHCTIPGCTSTAVTTTIPVVVTVEDSSSDPEPDVPVYAFDGSTYTGYNGTTDASGVVTMTLPMGGYRFRADKDGEQYWSGTSNHCTVPGCTAVTVTVGGSAAVPGGRAMAALLLPDLSLLLMAPLAVVALGRRKRWAWPVAGALLVVAVAGVGTALAAPASGAAVAEEVKVLPEESRKGEPAVMPESGFEPTPLLAVPEASVSLPTPSVQASGAVTTTQIITYTYDPLNRLTAADYSSGEAFAYEYDAVGNRTVFTQTLGSTTVTTYTYDAANRLTAAGNVEYTWDARGNLIGDGTFTYTYNAAGRLVRACRGEQLLALTTTLVYTYNASGLRVAQSVDGVEATFAWDTALPLAQVMATSDGALDLYGLGRIGELQGGEWAYPLADALGSVRQWTDDGGAVSYAAGYTPYGQALWQAGSTASAWGFTGEWWDADAELLYLRARWYDVYLNQFVSPDTIVPDFRNPQSINRYTYALGNPIRYTDPEGLAPQPPPLYQCSTVDAYNLSDWLVREMHHQSNHWPVQWGISLLNEIGRHYDPYDGGLGNSVIFSLLKNLQTYIPWNWEEHSYRNDIATLSYIGSSLWWAGMVKNEARWDFKHKIKAILGEDIILCDIGECGSVPGHLR